RAAARCAVGALVDPRETHHGVADVFVAARIEQRRNRRAAGAPELRDALIRLDAELVVEIAGRESAQHVLGEDRYLAPLAGVIEPVHVDVVELASVEG